MYNILFVFSNGIKVYTFGVIFIVVFFLFIWMLNHLAQKNKYSFDLFKNNILVLFLSSFIFSRLFYIIFHWNDYRTLSFKYFFITTDYNFSLYGAIFGFFLALLIILKIKKDNIIKYLDGIVLSFFFVLWIGYVGAFLGGQIYGLPTESWIGIYYDSNNTGHIPYAPTVKVTPLPLIYSVISFGIFCVLYMLRLTIKKRGVIGYLGLGLFACMSLGLEFLNGRKNDIFRDCFFNANQVCAILLLVFCGFILSEMFKLTTLEGPTNIIEDKS